MRQFLFQAEVWLPPPPEEVFNFFGDARNLQALTPEWIGFEIVTPVPISIGKGTLIDYRLRLHGFTVKWQTEITAWDPPRCFVDEQRRGPYRLWIHEHRFETRDGGTLVHDTVHYAIPGGWLIDRLFVRRDIRRIFEYRRTKLLELLGSMR